MSLGVSGFFGKIASLGLMMLAPLSGTALVGTTQGAADCQIWLSQTGITAGGSAQLVWSTTNATGATMSENAGSPISVAASGSIAVSPNSSRTYTLVSRNVNNNTSKTCTATLSVSSGATSAPTCAISATPGTHYAGQQVQLVWYTQNAQAATISNVGTVPSSQLTQGSITVAPTQSTLYTMTVGNTLGTRTCSAAVAITPQTTTAQTSTGYTWRPVQTATTYSSPSYSARPISFSSPSYRQSSNYNPYSYGYGNGSNYGNGSSYTTYDSWDTWDTPSRSSGLGEYSLTNIWNDVGQGGGISFTNYDCYQSDCSPYATSWGAGYPDGSYTYGLGDGMGYGASATRDASGNLIGYGSVPSEAESNAVFNDPRYQWSSGDSSAWSGSGSADQNYYGQQDTTYVPGVTYSVPTDQQALDNYGIYSGQPASSPFDYYTPTPYDSGTQSESEPAWYQWDSNGWNAGSSPGDSGVWYGDTYSNPEISS